MKPKLSPDYSRGLKRGIQLIYSTNPKWTPAERKIRQSVLRVIEGLKRNPK